MSQSTPTEPSLRLRVFRQLHPPASEHGLSLVNKCLVGLILLSVLTAVIETEVSVQSTSVHLFWLLEIAFS